MSVWSPIILMEFLLAPTVPSEPRPQNLQLVVPAAAVAGVTTVTATVDAVNLDTREVTL